VYVYKCLTLHSKVNLALGATGPLRADEAASQAALVEIEAALGGVPTFIHALPQAALPSSWAMARDLLFADTELDAKTKALISLGVAAQIPCTYCIWSDSQDARRAGATDEEIREAIAVAASTRYWSTVFNGNQIDLATFQAELGGE
jgi:AhpD family alkylhydroperoxidase